MSSVFTAGDGVVFSADKCINGETNGPREDTCHTEKERAPWLAISFVQTNTVSIEKVVLFSRTDSGWMRTKNVKIRLANQQPQSSQQMFSRGELLGTFDGPATEGQEVEIKSVSGWENKRGRYLIIQMDMGTETMYMNLKEVHAYGLSHVDTTGNEKLSLLLLILSN